MLMRHPETGTGKIELDVKAHRLILIVAERQRALVVGPHQVRIALLVGFDFRFLPRAAIAARFAEFPQIVNRPGPQRGFAVVAAEDVVLRHNEVPRGANG